MNEIRVSDDVGTVNFGQLKTGAMFRFANRQSDSNVYLKSQGHCVLLTSGLDCQIGDHRRVIPLARGTNVTITIN